ncbi:integrase domain-containing protein [Shewanella litorisediminis]|uniref:Tyrosine-type recombinase/integrase n=1 Tax=Shewanella litorisediminis TaxID=1173586 RepID=A0ABX7G013_9GAMM|nr:integrase domain-containing protein [Shewanella litorisediminis]MCL2918290.1 integrase domain-containing protein [Shewanella litorisediminis]QRH00661.1 tyrosine-type recombinase/integrase [Shewanella litorisediminis]
MGQLNDAKIKNLKPGEKDQVISDGEGLQLRLRVNGTKQWNFNYYHPVTKKRVNIGLGRYPAVSLAQARKLAMEQRELLAMDIDPKSHREAKLEERKQQSEYILEKIAAEWLEVKKHDVTADYATDIWRSLERYVFPSIGNSPLADITAPKVIALFRPLEAKGNLETVKRLNQRLNEIMTYAVNCGYVHSNPLSGIRAAFKKPKKQNMATIDPSELPDFIKTVAQASIKITTRALIEWQLHTMTRPSEAATARWEELDLEKKVWTIPAEKMKRRREHTIPLTPQMLGILEAMRPISGHREYIFPSDKDPKSHSHTQTANMAIKRMGFKDKLVSHGLRALASTTLNAQGFEPDLIEAALAHVDANQVRAAYNRTDYLERRRSMMEWWSKRIEEASQGSLSVSFRRVG